MTRSNSSPIVPLIRVPARHASARLLYQLRDLMVQERAFFSRIGKRITESQAKALLSGLGAS
jgi:hypothetical protein